MRLLIPGEKRTLKTTVFEIEQQPRHVMWLSLHRAVSLRLCEERKRVHYGSTSTDVVDTAYGYPYKQTNDIIRGRPWKTSLFHHWRRKNTSSLSIMHHGVHAEPTTLVLNWLLGTANEAQHRAFQAMAAGVEAGKIAVGNFANIPPFVENTSATNWIGVKKSLHRSFLVTFLRWVLSQFSRVSQSYRADLRLKLWSSKSINVKWKESFAKGRKDLQQRWRQNGTHRFWKRDEVRACDSGHMVSAYENVVLK